MPCSNVHDLQSCDRTLPELVIPDHDSIVNIKRLRDQVKAIWASHGHTHVFTTFPLGNDQFHPEFEVNLLNPPFCGLRETTGVYVAPEGFMVNWKKHDFEEWGEFAYDSIVKADMSESMLLQNHMRLRIGDNVRYWNLIYLLQSIYRQHTEAVDRSIQATMDRDLCSLDLTEMAKISNKHRLVIELVLPGEIN